MDKDVLVRSKTADIAKGISIILVIVGHFFAIGIIPVVIWSFHMPIFVLISGYFFKDYPLRIRINKSCKLLFVYLIVAFIQMSIRLCTMVVIGKYQPSFIVSSILSVLISPRERMNVGKYVVEPIGVIWFLLALFIGELVFSLILKVRNKLCRVCIAISIFALSFFLQMRNIYWFNVSGGLVFSIYLYIGWWYKKTAKRENSSFIYGGILAVWVIVVVTEIVRNKPFGIIQMEFPEYIWQMVGALCGCWCVIGLSVWLGKTVVSDKLSAVGNNSLIIMCVHSIDIICFSSLWSLKQMPIVVILLIRMSYTLIIARVVRTINDNVSVRKGD